MSIRLLRKIPLTAVILFLSILTGASISSPGTSGWPVIHLTDVQLANLRDGDLIFRKAEGALSDYIVSVDGKTDYSHAGLIHITGGRVMVINASFDRTKLATGVHEDDLDSFLSEVPLAAVYRLRDDSGGAAKAALEAAISLEGTPFDYKLNKDDASELYCTEFVWVAYQRAGVDLLEGRFSELDLPILGHGFYILPSDLIGSPLLVPVIILKSEQ